MIIRIESSVTLQVEERHYLKESRALEMEHDDIIILLATDPELKERYAGAAPGDRLDFEAVQDAFYVGFEALKVGLWEALDEQLKELLPASDDEEEKR